MSHNVRKRGARGKAETLRRKQARMVKYAPVEFTLTTLHHV